MTDLKLIAIAVLATTSLLFAWLWQEETKAFSEFKGAIVVLGQEAEKHAKEVEAKHNQVVKEMTNDWNQRLPSIRSTAVSNYLRRFPNGVLGSPGCGDVPGAPKDSQAPGGAIEERVATGPTDGQQAFVANCAEDAAVRRQVKEWADRVGVRPE